MTIELDHFFILTDLGAPHADLLSGIGLIEGPRNDHLGQGTANRRFFFSNTALELLYVNDANEAANGRGSRFGSRSLLTGADTPAALLEHCTVGMWMHTSSDERLLVAECGQ